MPTIDRRIDTLPAMGWLMIGMLIIISTRLAQEFNRSR